MDIQKETGLVFPKKMAILKQEIKDSEYYSKSVTLQLLNQTDIDSIKSQIIRSKQFTIDSTSYELRIDNIRPLISLRLDTLNGMIQYYYETKN